MPPRAICAECETGLFDRWTAGRHRMKPVSGKERCNASFGFERMRGSDAVRADGGVSSPQRLDLGKGVAARQAPRPARCSCGQKVMTMVDDPRGHRVRARLRYYQGCARRRISPGFRSVAGLCLVALGIVGFLPVVGFWMIPLGFALIWLDLEPFVTRSARRRKKRRAASNASASKRKGNP